MVVLTPFVSFYTKILVIAFQVILFTHVLKVQSCFSLRVLCYVVVQCSRILLYKEGISVV